MSDTAFKQDTESQSRRASPWPLVVALGFTFSEAGIILGFRTIAITGLLMFIWSLTGILHETGYVANPAWTLTALGGLSASSGLWLILSSRIGAPVRGQALLIAGIVSLLTAIVWRVRARRNPAASRADEPQSEDYPASGGDD